MSGVMLLLIGVLGFVAVAGLGFVFAGSGSSQGPGSKRIQTVAAQAASPKEKGRGRAANVDPAGVRRKQIVETLRAAEKEQRKTRLAVESRLRQAGLAVSVRQFWTFCIVLAVVVAGVMLFLRVNPLVALGLGFGVGLGTPRWALGFLIKRRNRNFTEEFPNAIDIVVRGIKSGLPVHDCLRVIARESPEPIASEFQRLVEGLGVGLSLDQGLEKMYERMSTAEVRFFAIVMAIQQKTGGNLAEALSNLSTVLRSRKLMREKIKAMSGEAVASACIIGSLPPGIMALVSVTAPAYMAPLYGDSRGHLMLLVGGFWMGAGIFTMRRMINLKV